MLERTAFDRTEAHGSSGGCYRLAIDRDRDWVPVPLGFVALSFTLKLPAAAGAPDMRPVVEAIESPGGKPAAANVFGPPVLSTW